MFRYNTAPDYHAERVAFERAVSKAYYGGEDRGTRTERARLTRLLDNGEHSYVLGSVPEYPRYRVAMTPDLPPMLHGKSVPDLMFLRPGFEEWEFEAEQHCIGQGNTTVRWFTWRRVR